MEKRIKAYEEFIKAEAKKKMSDAERKRLFEYHVEMVRSFQHERFIHLIITLFFAILAIFSVIFCGLILANSCCFSIEMVPVMVLPVVLVILTLFYVKHYYFLENHVQKLYDVTKGFFNKDE